MAALSANATTPPRPHPETFTGEFTFKATGADEYYNGAVVCGAAGKAILTNLDAHETLGFCLNRVTISAADEPVKVHVLGVWWVAAGGIADGDNFALFAPTAASDNPADLINQAAGTPGALGRLIHVDVTGTSGWLDLGQRSVPANS